MKVERQQEKKRLLKNQKESGETTKETWKEFPDVPDLKTNRRPIKGIFLTYFLMFAGLLFFSHGIHRFEEYSVWDLIATWVLSSLLIIPGLFYGVIIVAIQFGVKGFSYKNHPELEF